jgi:hypothetical protein
LQKKVRHVPNYRNGIKGRIFVVRQPNLLF